jgi:hypothetical protein
VCKIVSSVTQIKAACGASPARARAGSGTAAIAVIGIAPIAAGRQAVHLSIFPSPQTVATFIPLGMARATSRSPFPALDPIVSTVPETRH